MDESGKSQDFFLNNRPSERKYTTTRINSRNFLSNISYVGINKEDFYNENFIFDIYLLVTKNLNPFSLNRKLNDKNKHEMICMLWKQCMPQKFYQYICREKNFLYLNGKKGLQPKVSEILTEFLKEDQENYVALIITYQSIKTFFNMFIQMFSLKFIAPKKGEISTLKAPFTLFLKLTRTRKKWNH